MNCLCYNLYMANPTTDDTRRGGLVPGFVSKPTLTSPVHGRIYVPKYLLYIEHDLCHSLVKNARKLFSKLT